MKKEMYIIAGREEENYSVFIDRMVATAAEAAFHSRPLAASVTLTETAPPRLSVIPFKRRKIAVISLFRQDDSSPPSRILTELDGFRFACRTEEALPVAYDPSWPVGTVTPGVCLLTLFKPRPGISRDAFIDRWHNSHTPLSLRIHPLWHYNRNVVLGIFAGEETGWGGIVEEHFRQRGQLLNPFRFFGHPGVVVQRMLAVYSDTKAFLDYGTIETYLAREYRVFSAR